jgi:PAS domain S-box-containing protein
MRTDTEQKYHALMENASDAILLADADGNIVETNRKAEELFGYGREEFLKKNIKLLHPAEEMKKIDLTFKEVIKNGYAKISDTLILRKDGKAIPVDITCSSIDQDGKKFAQAIMRDTSEHRRAEDELRERERFLATVFSSIQDGISVLDKEMNIIRVNETMEKWYKHAMPIVGKKCYEVYHGRDKHCESCPVVKSFKSGKMEHELSPKTGPSGTTIGWFDLYSFPLKDDKTGELTGAVEYVHDITERMKAEEALRKSEEQYRHIVETATEGIWIIDSDDRISFANHRISEMFGCRVEDLIGKEVFALMDDEWKVTARSDIESLRRGGRERHDFKFHREDGNDLWAIVSATPLFDHNGRYSGALEMITSISERKRAEEASRSIENRYRKLMESANDAIILADADTGIIIDANKKAEDLLGLPLERIVGMQQSQLHPKDKARFYKRLFEQHVNDSATSMTDLLVLRSDGSTVPVDIRANVVRIGNKKVLQGIFRDMSERKASEAKLIASEDRLRAILDNSTALIYGRGMNGQYIFVNKVFEKLFHLKEKRVVGNTPYDIFTKEIADMFQSTDVRVLDTAEPLETEEILPLPDGIHTYTSLKFPLLDSEKRIYAMCAIATDITQRKKAELEANKYKVELEGLLKRRTAQVEEESTSRMKMESELEKKNKQLEDMSSKYATGPAKSEKRPGRKKG